LQDRKGLIDSLDTRFIRCVHHRTASTLAASAAEGCRICKPFWKDELSDVHRQALRDATNLRNPNDRLGLAEWVTEIKLLSTAERDKPLWYWCSIEINPHIAAREGIIAMVSPHFLVPQAGTC
jgi:hypothetical protein